MPWCPNCKNEYVEGITKCADCGCELVEELKEEEDLSESWENSGVPLSLLQNIQEEETGLGSGVYKGSDEKASEFKDSAYTLIGVGGAGLVLVLLLALGAIPVRIPFALPYLMYGVMGILFLIFLIAGIRSLQSAKVYKKKALSESNLKDEIMGWCRESLTVEAIDAQAGSRIKPEERSGCGEELSKEEIYFQRTAAIREQICKKFMNIDDAFLDNLIDEFYSEIFGE